MALLSIPRFYTLMRILLVEDDEMLSNAIISTLHSEGYTIDRVSKGQQSLIALSNEDFSLIILDLGLPDMDGFDVLSQLRQQKNDTPVIILSARGDTLDRISGLDRGADDYIAKPFDIDELLARIRAISRRRGRATTNMQVVGDLTVNRANCHVTWKKKPVTLTQAEYKLLIELIDTRGRIITRDHIAGLIYGWDEPAESNVVEVHIHNLRKKLDKSFISTMRGVGYFIPLDSA